jgi:type IV pilus assembly protein PilB
MISKWTEKLPKMPRMGELLVKKGFVTIGQVDEAVEYKKSHDVRIGEALVALGYTSEDSVLQVFAEGLGMEFIPHLDGKWLAENGFDHGLFYKFNFGMLDHISIIPLRVDVEISPEATVQMWKLHVILNDPWQFESVNTLASELIKRTKADKQISLLKESGGAGGSFEQGEDFEIEVIGYLAKKTEIGSVLGELSQQALSIDSFQSKEDESQVAARQFSEIVNSAILRNATDIHITPMHGRGGLHVRFRIDGEVESVIRNGRMTDQEWNVFLNKAMTMASMDTTRKREPQDGYIQYPHDRNVYDLRVACIPTSLYGVNLEGAKIQIRILRSNKSLSLQHLGFGEDMLGLLKEIYTQPSGVVLCAGPTGSGKTTTVYSVLQQLDLERQVCYTIEDPVEYRLESATQIPVSEREGRSFATILKSLLRLDPDIVFLGEIRDPESAAIAIQIANTGHTVLSTIHTNSAYTTPLRLRTMGIPEYLLVGNLNGVIAQRLVKRICPTCRQPYTPSAHAIRTLQLPDDRPYFKGTGKVDGMTCPDCGGKGIRSRLGIYEILPLCKYEGWEEYLGDPNKLRDFMFERGHYDMMYDAMVKMTSGLICPDDLCAVMSRLEGGEA